MTEKIAYINLDYLPPSAETLCSIPSRVLEDGYNSICLKVIDNFPWDFEDRMKSCSSFDESAVGFLSKECVRLDLKLILKFPDDEDFVRILRLNGYKRMSDTKKRRLVLDPDTLGFKQFIESIAEDWITICPQSAFAISAAARNTVYSLRAADILKSEGYDLRSISESTKFVTAELFLSGAESELLTSLENMVSIYHKLSLSLADLRQMLIMSSLSFNPPAPGLKGLNRMMLDMKAQRKLFDESADSFRKKAEGRLDPDWCGISIKAYRLSLDEELTQVEHKLRQTGLLN